MSEKTSRWNKNGDGGDEDRTVDISEGKVRRTGKPGGRGFMEYFSDENRNREVRRGELLGMLEMLEYTRRESTWWRRLWRRFLGHPGPWNLPAQMAESYEVKTLRPALAAAQKQLEQAEKERAERQRRELEDATAEGRAPTIIRPEP